MAQIGEWMFTYDELGMYPPFIKMQLFDDGSATMTVRASADRTTGKLMVGAEVWYPLSAERVRDLSAALVEHVARTTRARSYNPPPEVA